jgi:hypothetical protein
MVMIRGVFVYFEILAGFPRVPVRSAEVWLDYLTLTLTQMELERTL